MWDSRQRSTDREPGRALILEAQRRYPVANRPNRPNPAEPQQNWAGSGEGIGPGITAAGARECALISLKGCAMIPKWARRYAGCGGSRKGPAIGRDSQAETISMPELSAHACFECRKVFKKPHWYKAKDTPVPPEYPCPECGTILTAMGHKFRAPRRDDVKNWNRIRNAIETGTVWEVQTIRKEEEKPDAVAG
jgi:hypothetical protein